MLGSAYTADSRADPPPATAPTETDAAPNETIEAESAGPDANAAFQAEGVNSGGADEEEDAADASFPAWVNGTTPVADSQSADNHAPRPSTIAISGASGSTSSSSGRGRYNGTRRKTVIVLRRHGEREIQNEEWLLKRLNALRGVDVRILDDRAFPEQEAVLSLFASADAVVAAHGAGLTNAIVAKPGACVIEVMPRAWFVPCYWRMNGHLGLRHNMFVTIGDKRSALVLNIRRVVRALRECMQAQEAADYRQRRWTSGRVARRRQRKGKR